MTYSYDDEITIREFDPDDDVFIRPGRGGTNRTFHVFEDCPNGAHNMLDKDPSVLYDDMILCSQCRYEIEQEGREIPA